MGSANKLVTATVAAFLALSVGCRDEVLLERTTPPECIRLFAPKSYEIYFVIDVSGSMGPFLSAVKDELVAFSQNLPQFDDDGNRVPITFHVIAFVNDVRWYPTKEQIFDPLIVQAAFESAIEDGQTDLNLNSPTINAEPAENLLDALAEVVANRPSAEANLVLVATDAGFVESPASLSGIASVEAMYADVVTGLDEVGARVHAFAKPNADGLTRRWQGLPALTSLEGSSHHDLFALTGASDAIRETLVIIAMDADCN